MKMVFNTILHQLLSIGVIGQFSYSLLLISNNYLSLNCREIGVELELEPNLGEFVSLSELARGKTNEKIKIERNFRIFACTIYTLTFYWMKFFSILIIYYQYFRYGNPMGYSPSKKHK